MMHKHDSGFTLIELIAVLILLGILAVVALPQYRNLSNDASRQMATSLDAAAQSQLTLEFTRRSMNGETLSVTAQTVCDMVAVSTAGQSVAIVCPGDLTDAGVSITATVEGQSANGDWNSPQSGS